MEHIEATQALEQAQRLGGRARQAGRWYAIYLVAFAIASVIFAGLFGVVGNRWGSILLTPLWGVFLAVLTVWSQRKKTSLVGMGRLHVTVIACWAVLWGVTVIVGSFAFQGQPLWWIAGGVAMAVPCLVGARTAFRRTSA
jgi:hypothetical protein